MSPKEKLKQQPTQQEYAPFWMYLVFVVLLMITSIFPLFHILNAYPHVYEFQSIAWSTLRWFGFILCVVLFISIYLETQSRPRWLLSIFMVVVAYATIFHGGVGLLVVGGLALPFTLVAFPSYFIGLSLMRVFKRKHYILEIVGLIGLEILFALGIITVNWYMSTPYDTVSQHDTEERSYHLILDSGYLDPTFIEIHECNMAGLFCREIFSSSDDYYDDDIQWDVVSGTKNLQFSILVNDEVVYTHELSQTSD